MKRLIKPDFDKAKVLKVLNREGGTVIVFDRKNRPEAREYAKVHELLYSLDKNGLIRIGYIYSSEKGTDEVYAIIEDPGREWLENIWWQRVTLWTSIAAALIALVALIINICKD